MPKCSNCGKKGLFLSLDSRGLCSDCKRKAQMVNDKPIVISALREHTNIGHKLEENACNYFIDELCKLNYSRDKFSIEHKSDDYTTLVYGLSDILRIKITSLAQWISIPLAQEDRSNNNLFVIDGNILFCRSKIENTEDLSVYVPYLTRVSVFEKYGTDRELTEKEIDALNYVFKVMIANGAEDINEYYLYKLTNEVELIYKDNICCVRLKIHAKKKGGYITNNCIKNDKHKFEFSEITEVDEVVAKITKRGLDELTRRGKVYADMENYDKFIPQ